MPRSMTGYGAASADILGGHLAVEMRSVNHRFLDVKCKLPNGLASMEPLILKVTRKRLKRGRVELNMLWEAAPTKLSTIKVDLELAKSYLESYEQLKDSLWLPGEVDLNLIASVPDLVQRKIESLNIETTGGEITDLVEQALKALVATRSSEGKALAADAMGRVARLRELYELCAREVEFHTLNAHEYLVERIKKLVGDIPLDENRLIQEAAYMVERADISEELARLDNLLKTLDEVLKNDSDSIGRKLDFMVQEVNREINTIGAKAFGQALPALVVEFKSELEKIREQAQNLE